MRPPYTGGLHFKCCLEIDLTDDCQIETAGYRIDAHQEVGVAACSLEPAGAAHEVEDSLIDSRDWIEDSVNLNLKLIAVGSATSQQSYDEPVGPRRKQAIEWRKPSQRPGL